MIVWRFAILMQSGISRHFSWPIKFGTGETTVVRRSSGGYHTQLLRIVRALEQR